ncbi:FtsK/SpoIIIE domain-containing protein [Nonomuraea sp. NEAU-A123]|uniref:FtsK/SpoIIIE domain-containing protein n=1 Tax=Nonomuraea sp. NEAU-A123 TaxID=2839649 RepID=UPI001BE48948|nr:FtsK/SpoIIIE domain-containing protein [Nonomuraea sp. NEAU-A123]MBT2234461.1 cell division protein FtsK [Nonomuraea sp. NEAU-A123]
MTVIEEMHGSVVAALQDESSPLAHEAASTPASENPTQEVTNENDVLEGRVVLVDQPHEPGPVDLLAELAARRQERSPLIPVWLKSRADALQVLKWQAEHTGYVLAYHVLHTPKYAAKLTARSPAGAWRLLVELVRWLFDLEGRPVRRAAVSKEQAAEYLALARQRDGRVKARLWTVLVGAITLVLVGIFVAVAAPTWAHWAIIGVLVSAAGLIGSPADKPLLDRAVISSHVRKLTSDQVVDALGSLGISTINQALGKSGRGITFPAPIMRDGPGWRAEIDLPLGVTVSEVLDKRDKLASGLRRALGCVWPEPVSEEHPGRLVLWVGDQEMRKARQPAWPLLKSGQVSLFDPIPYGNDQRGRPIKILLMFANVLIGSMPRYGKTFALRVLLLACALDPLAELRLFELKGTGDLSALEKVAHHYAKGATDTAKAACVASLAEVYAELDRRAEVIDGLPRHQAPEFKVTPELAAHKDLGLHPMVVAIDECQELFADDEYGQEAAKYATAIIKRGPALGIILILATQRPDKDSLPKAISANAGIRICLRVMGWQENDMILGTGLHQAGVKATMFTLNDKGIAWAVGIAEDPLIVRSAYLDGPTSELIAERAYQLRQAAGTLSGQAIGQEPAKRASYDLLADILTVTTANEEKLWDRTVVDRLAELRPDAYGQWAGLEDDAKTATLTARLKEYGVKTEDTWGRDSAGKGRNRKGFNRADVTQALAQRKI